MKDKVQLTFMNKEIEIKKIPFIKFGELALTLNSLPEIIKDIFSEEDDLQLNFNDILDKAPSILSQLFFTLPSFLAVASGIEKEKIEQAGLDDVLPVIHAVLEVNNLEVIVKHLKNLMTVLPR